MFLQYVEGRFVLWKRKRLKPKKRKSSFLLALGFCVLAGFVAIKLVQLQIDINDRKQVLTDTQAQYNQLIEENKELDGIVAGGNEAEYMERIARDSLGYVKPGERVYYDISFGG